MAKREVSVLIKAIDHFSKTANKIEKNTKGLSKTFKNLGKTIGVAFGGYEIFNFFRSTIKGAEYQEAVNMQLAQSISQVGLNVAEVFPQMKKLSSYFEATTTYGNEEVEMLEALYLRYGVMPKQMEGVIQATMDYARVTGKDIRSASLDMAKAMQGNLTMLQRYGIQVSKATFKSQGLPAIIEAIEERMGGAEQAEVNTYAGRVKQLSNYFGDLKKNIGKAVIKNDAMAEGISKLTDAFQQIIKDLRTNGSALNDFATNFGVLVQKVAEGLPTIVKAGAVVGSWISKAFKVAGIFIGDYAGAIYTGNLNLKDFVKTLKEDLKETENDAKATKDNADIVNQFKNAHAKASNAIANEGINLAKLNTHLRTNTTALKKVNDQVSTYIQNLQVSVDTEKKAKELDAINEQTKEYADWVDSITDLSRRLSDNFMTMMEGTQVSWSEMLSNMLKDLERFVIEALAKFAILEIVNTATGGTLSIGEAMGASFGIPMATPAPTGIGGGIAPNLEVHVHNATPDTYVKVFQSMPKGAKIKIREALA